jgi:hypothetical protein
VSGALGTYVDRAGVAWRVTSFEFQMGDAGGAARGFIVGSYTAEVTTGTLSLALSGRLYVCGAVDTLLRPCPW